MIKRMIALLILVTMVFFGSSTLLAAGPTGPAGKSPIGHLYLFEKDPTTWDIVENGAWGKMKYRLWGPAFDFVFNGHLLEPGLDYTLIYYPDPWPGNGLICLGSGVVDAEGDVHIKGKIKTDTLPAAFDANNGAKIWLVLTGDVNCNTPSSMVTWDPSNYLFEYGLIEYTEKGSRK